MQRIRRVSILIAMVALAAGVLASSASAALPTFGYSFSIGKYGSGNGELGNPGGIVTDASGNIWVADSENNRIEGFNSKGEYLSQFKGSLSEQLSFPSDLAIDSGGNFWVVDTFHHKIRKFNSKGELQLSFGEAGPENGHLYFPESIAIDSVGNIWVADTENYRVQEFNSKGVFLTKFGTQGSANNQFLYPHGIAFDSLGHIWVLDGYGAEASVKEFNTNGGYITKVGQGELGSTLGAALTIGAEDNLWVSENESNLIKVFNTKGEKLTQFGGGEGWEVDSPGQPSGIAFDASGNPWIASWGTGRIEKWAPTPVTATYAATEITGTGAKLSSTTNPQGFSTTVQFEYGTTTAYGSKAPAAPKEIGSGKSPVAFNQPISGLTSGTTYHFRVVAQSSQGASYGKDLTFTTLSKPTNLTLPAISPNPPDQLSPASTTSGTWSGSPTSYAYQWQRCNAVGAECANIAGATASTYTPVAADVEKTLVAKVTATNAVGSTEASSKATGKVTPTTITEYAMENQPQAITAGPDSNLWYTTELKIGKITTAGVKTEYSLPAAGARDIVTGPDGNLWYVTYASGLGKITTAGAITTYPAPVGVSGLVAITSGPDGNLWFVARSSNKIGKITTAGTVTTYSLPASSAPADIVAGPDGNLWFTEAGTNKIGKITTAGTITEYAVPAGSVLEQITSNPSDGKLWYTAGGTNKIGKITTAGAITEYSLPTGSVPLGIVAKSSGDVWFTENGVGKIGKITTSGTISEYSLPAESYPRGIAVGSDGNLWFAGQTLSEFEWIGKIGKITP